MGKMVNLSNKTQELIKQYIELGCPKESSLHSFSSAVDQRLLVNCLYGEVTTPSPSSKKSKKEIEFLLASLRAELLRDLLVSMGGSQDKEEQPSSKLARLKFYLIAASGTILAACEGFDSISTLLGVFALPAVVTLLAGLAFSALSVMVFYGFNLVQVSKNLGVKLSDAPKLLDLHLVQLDEIKSIRKKINTYKLATLSTEELDNLAHIISMLEKRFESLSESSKQFKEALNSPKMAIAKNIFVGVAGLLFFGGGFFAGQSVGVFMLGLVIGSVAPTFLPVVLFSVAVGLAAFSLYWYVEKVGLQQLISGLFGLDEEKIEKLCNQEELEKQAQKLTNLKEKIMETAELTQQIKILKKQSHEESSEEADVSKKRAPLTINTDLSPSGAVIGNIYSFHKSMPTKSEIVSNALDEDELASSVCN